LIIKFKKLLNVPIVYEFHDLKLLENNIPHAMEKYIITNADGLIVTTNALMAMIKKYYRRNNLIEKIPLAGIPFDFKIKVHENESIPHFKVFYIGSLYYLQGVDILIKSFEYLKDYPCSLHIVGGMDTEIHELEKIAKEIGIHDRIVFYGYRKPMELSTLLYESDILVMPSRAEGRMPYVAHTKIYEYLFLGKPIVATDMESVREVLTDGINAVIVEPDNPEALAKGIIRIILNPQFRKQISDNALKASQNYTWQKRAQRLIEFFNRVTDKE
jgi:glycosyltransferase involved in cell wall biosynthesis